MPCMTWKQFKDGVDKQMQEKGISEDTEIWYIDFSFPDADGFEKENMGVFYGVDDLGLVIQ